MTKFIKRPTLKHRYRASKCEREREREREKEREGERNKEESIPVTWYTKYNFPPDSVRQTDNEQCGSSFTSFFLFPSQRSHRHRKGGSVAVM